MNSMKKRTSAWITICLVVPILLLSGCSLKSKTGKLKLKDLPDSDRQFLKYVSYIMTKAEKKKFFSMVTAEDRAAFRAEFWKKRDPDSGTDENEYKKNYFARIEEANRLFSKGKYEGFRTDRGRVLVLLGPPETKHIYPTGYRIGAYPMEVWLYGYYNYPVIFIDRTQSGNYELTSNSARHVAEMNKAKVYFNPVKGVTKNPFGFTLRLFKDKKSGNHNLQIMIPYKNIVFQKGKEGFTAAVNVKIEINDTKTKKSQTMDKDHNIAITPDQLDNLKDNYIFTIPLKLAAGKYETTVVVESKADKIKVQDKISFKI